MVVLNGQTNGTINCKNKHFDKINCRTKGSCKDGILVLYSSCHVTIICNGNNICIGTRFTSNGFDYTNTATFSNNNCTTILVFGN